LPNPTPLQYDHFYHIFNRGNNRDDIFMEERNYRYFLQLYTEHVLPVADTYAYCLMRNHFHFLVRIVTPQEQALTGLTTLSGLPRKPSQHFSNLFNAYAQAFNRAHDRTGALFQRPFGRILITSDAYFEQLVTYIHRNPQKHGFVDDFREWPFSSYQAMLSTKPTHLARDEVLQWFEGVTSYESAHLSEMDGGMIQVLVPDDFE
jgi:REP element-mobilizing transposase RayT